MRFRRLLFAIALVIPLCRFASPVVAQEASGAPRPISLSLQPTSSHLSLHLRGEGGSVQTYDCDGPCVLDVMPGHYQLGVVDGQGEPDWHPVYLSESETIEVHRSHKGLAIAGTVLYATGVALAAVGLGAFMYGAVSNLETMECDTACGGVSARFIKMSLAGAGVGLALAAVGGVIIYSTRGPTMVEKLGVEPRPLASKAGELSFALVPDLHAPRAPIASMSLTF